MSKFVLPTFNRTIVKRQKIQKLTLEDRKKQIKNIYHRLNSISYQKSIKQTNKSFHTLFFSALEFNDLYIRSTFLMKRLMTWLILFPISSIFQQSSSFMVVFLSQGSDILAQIMTRSMRSRILNKGFSLAENWANVLKATYLSFLFTFLF